MRYATIILCIVLAVCSAFGQEARQAYPEPVVVQANLRLLKQFSGGTNSGTFTFTVTNLGPGSEPGPITITDALPNGLTFAGGAGCIAVGQNVTCTIPGSLSPGNSVAVSFNINITATTSVLNCASVAGKAFDPNKENNRSCTCINPRIPCETLKIDISTGSNNGSLGVGASDPDWKVISVPAGATGANQQAIVPTKPAAWMTPPSNSNWIIAKPAAGTTPQIKVGDYRYQFNFFLPPELRGGKCHLNARYAVDNLITVKVDNVPAVSNQNYTSANFTALNAVPAFSFAANPGPHTLDLIVHNGTAAQTSGDEAVTGVLLVGSIECDCAPQP